MTCLAPLCISFASNPAIIAGTIPTFEKIEYLPPISSLCSNKRQLFFFAILSKGEALNWVIIKQFE